MAPNKYFIEVLMGCDSATRFCWGFIVTESSKKVVPNHVLRGMIIRYQEDRAAAAAAAAAAAGAGAASSAAAARGGAAAAHGHGLG